jgi:steroid delta-isomerase-like uncharacterized protein
MKTINCLFILSIILSSCSNNGNNGNGNSSAAYNEKRMQEFYDQVMNAHNVAMADSFCTSDFVDHQAMENTPAGIEGVKKTFTEYFAAYPDLHVKTNFIKSFGDTIVAHITMSGTSKGPFMGMPATGKQFSVDGVDIIKIKDGKATEHWGYEEDMKMMNQLGLGGGGAPSAGQTASADSTKK